MPLSFFDVKAAHTKDKPYRLADGDGLYLQIQPNGSKLWRFRYRFAGMEKMLSVGAFPTVSIADARRKRDDARKLLESGTDPTAQKRLDRLAAETAARTTFGLVAEEYLANLAANGVAASTLSKIRWLLENLAKPIASRPVSEITPAEILDLLGDPVLAEKQRRFGQAKYDTLPKYCRECPVLFACYGECPRNRFVRTPAGEEALNYLCEGYKAFFQHIDKPMRIMADLVGKRRYADEIMAMDLR
jgi:radical SAM protein with 4Fe4S-binding SPASM domain